MARDKARRGWPRRIASWVLRAFFAFIIVTLLWVLLYAIVPPPVTATMIGDMLAGRGVTKDWTPLERIDRDMVRAAIASEDSKFCSHDGFDREAIEAAMRRNAKGGRIRGGSTISQQTAKNAFLWQGGGYFRKGLEAYFTLLIENIWGKRRIMEVYLNVAETGIGTYGVEAGAQRYFGHGADSLSRTVAARIGVVQRDGLDACVYASGETSAPDRADPPAKSKAKTKAKKSEAPPPAAPLPGEEYEAPEVSLPPEAPSAEPAPEPAAAPEAPPPPAEPGPTPL